MNNIIIGGGPAGSYLAYLLAKNGEKVELYEMNPRQDKQPKPCSGGIATWWVQRTKVPLTKEVIGDEIKTVKILYGTKTIWEASPGGVAGYVLNRGVFERYLQREAENYGAKVIYKPRYNHFEDYDRVFLAEGAGGTIKKHLGMDEHREIDDFHLGVQLIGSGDVEPHVLEVYADDMLQGGYLWRFPHAMGVEVGLGVPLSQAQTAWKILYKWLDKMGWKFNPVIKQTHVIPTNYPQKQRFGKFMLLGDNAYLTGPITGGGIHAALYSALRASEGKTVSAQFRMQTRLMYMAKQKILKMKPSEVADLIENLHVTYNLGESPYKKFTTIIKAMWGVLGYGI